MKPTTNIQSLSIMATIRIYDELVLLLRSIYLFHPDIPIFILAQPAVCEKLMHEKQIPTNITLIPGMEEYGEQHWEDLPTKQAIRFLNSKTHVMQQALKKYTNTLFLDTDIILTLPLGLVDNSKDIGLTPRLFPSRANILRKYYAGWVFCSNNAFPDWWSQKVTSSNNRFAEEVVLDEAKRVFNSFIFPIVYNFIPQSHLFLFPGSKKYLHRALQFKSGPNQTLIYRNQVIVSIHTHWFTPRVSNPVNNWVLFYLHKQLPILFNEINCRRNGDLPYQVSQQDALFFLCSFCFSHTLFRVYQTKCFDYIFSITENISYKINSILKRTLLLFIWPYYLWYLKQEIVYLYYLLVHKKAMLTKKAFIGYIIRFIFLLPLSPITKRIHRNRKT